MNAPEGLDIRVPIGGLFAVLGGMLAAYGLFAGSGGSPDRSSAANVNLWWGLVMLVFGIALLLLARRRDATGGPRAPGESGDGEPGVADQSVSPVVGGRRNLSRRS